MADNNAKAVRYGCGSASDSALAQSMVIAALTNKEIPYSVAAMMSEAAARLSVEGWRLGIHEWESEHLTETLDGKSILR